MEFHLNRTADQGCWHLNLEAGKLAKRHLKWCSSKLFWKPMCRGGFSLLLEYFELIHQGECVPGKGLILNFLYKI